MILRLMILKNLGGEKSHEKKMGRKMIQPLKTKQKLKNLII